MADIHANRLAAAHSFPTDPLFSEPFRSQIEEEIQEQQALLQPNFAVPKMWEVDDKEFTDEVRIGRHNKRFPPTIHPNKITTNEIKEVLKRKKNKSSAGEDGISYKILKHAGSKFLTSLARFFTCLLVTGYFPKPWRSVRVKMIPKAGKDTTTSKGWRPISLSSCTSKVFESCIKSRLTKEQQASGAGNVHQAAYKQGRSAQEHLLRLSECVTNAFKQKQSVIAVFLDVEGAFDKVWVNGLLRKVFSARFSDNLTRLIASFLKERSLKVRVGDADSCRVHMKAGTPQGAVLSPTLFNLFVDDIETLIGEGVQLAQYADDIAIWVADECPRRAEQKMNETLSKISTWTSRWRVKLAPEKSAFILFSKRPTHSRMTIRLQLLGKEIQRVSSHRFLGVKFDEKLLWKQHIQEILGSAMPRTAALKALAAKSIWRRPDWILKLHESIVNSIWKYGSVAFAAMCEEQWSKIQKVHANCVKSYAGVPQYVSYETVRNHLGIHDIKTNILNAAKKRILAITAYSPFGRKLVEDTFIQSANNYKGPIATVINAEDRERLVALRIT